jgi:ABC-type sugar transport system substrate-binding protein
MIKAANAANIPIVLYNRPADLTDARSVAVVADNYAITKATVEYMCEQVKKSGRKYKAAILIGDLGDINAVGRRDGFEDAAEQCGDIIEVVARIPTEWNGEKARAGVTNALQAHPDINFIFTSSDFMLPPIVQALKDASKYNKIGEEGHVLLGGFDGDATAYQMLLDGYLDADGVQDVYFESEAAVQGVLDMKAGWDVPAKILDPGSVIHQGNLKEMAGKMWGAQVKKQAAGTY